MTSAASPELLDQARRARWAFPTSRSARRVTRPGEDSWVPELDALRPRFTELIRAGGADALEVAARTWRLWPLAGDDDEVRQLLEGAAAAAGDQPTPWAVHVHYGAALLAHRAGDLAAQRRHSVAAVALAEHLNDAEATTLAHLAASRTAFDEGRAGDAVAHARTSHAASRQLPAELQQSPLGLLAQSLRLDGDFAAAAEYFERSLHLNREIRDSGMVAADTFNLALMQVRLGHADAAEAVLAAGGGEIDPADPVGRVLVGVVEAGIATARGDLQRATAVLREAQGIQTSHAVELAPEDQADLDWLRARLAQ